MRLQDAGREARIRQPPFLRALRASVVLLLDEIVSRSERAGASWLNDNDVLVTDTHSSQLCSIDVVRLFDNASRMPNGSVGLGKFIPYTKPKNS